jgi:hypothetical protein
MLYQSSEKKIGDRRKQIKSIQLRKKELRKNSKGLIHPETDLKSNDDSKVLPLDTLHPFLPDTFKQLLNNAMVI